MKTDKEWLRTLLAIGMFFSCFILALSIIYVFINTIDQGSIPAGFYIMPLFCFLVLSLVVFFAEEEAWKTITKLLVYTFSLIFLGALGYGIKIVIDTITGETTTGTLTQGLIAASLSSCLLWFAIKLLKSKWLN